MDDGAKRDLQELMKKRAMLEGKLAEHTARLQAAGVGMRDPLTDKDGFPRQDAAEIRADRQQAAVLTNDLKALMTQAERLLQQLHAPLKAAASAAGARQASASPRVAARRPPQAAPAAEPSSAATSASPQSLGSALLRPFAVVDEVAEGSPAGQAGIAVGDQMLRFAGVQAQPSALQAVAAALQANAGRTVQAEFLRQGRLVQVQLDLHVFAGFVQPLQNHQQGHLKTEFTSPPRLLPPQDLALKDDAMMGKPSSLLAHALLLLSTQQHQKDAQDIPAWLWMLAPVFWLFPATLQLAAFCAAMQCIFSKHLSELLARLEDHAYGMTPDPGILWGPPVKPARPSQEPVLPAIYEELELCSDDDSVSELGSFATSSHMCDSPPSVFQFD